ncbi:hypothetical protein Q7P37_011454 [Cladosporium fusiforme]
MRSFLPIATAAAAIIAFACAAQTPTRDIDVLQYDIQTQHAIFSLPCASCEATQADLVFDFQPAAPIPREGCEDIVDLVLNGQRLDFCFSKGYLQEHLTAESSVLLDVTDTVNERHIVNITADAQSSSRPAKDDQNHDHYTADIILKVVSIDDIILAPPTEVFTQLDVFPERRLRTLLYHPSPRLITFDKYPQSFTTFQPPPKMERLDKNTLLDIEDELDVLRMLEADAVALQAELAARKLAVNQHFHKQFANVPLKELVEHCDGIICAAKLIAGRLCDKMGVGADNPPDYSQIDSHLQYMITGSGSTGSEQQPSKSCVGSEKSNGCEQVEVTQTEKSNHRVSSEYGTTEGKPKFLPKKNLHNPLVIALEILAGILGLSTLCAYIRRKCMSMRKRVERAADKEERRNARAYRRAARRALIHKRWNNFVGAISCFGTPKEPKIESYEEKRALILQDAFLEQDLELAEKGEVMEAEIRELRNAHDIVAGLIGVDEHRYDLAHHSPPPHAYIPNALSRRSTGGTLPSYTSESLPDYTSTPDTSHRSSRVADGFVNYTPTDSESERGASRSTRSSGSRQTRYTPVSSVMAISPRCSAETLRTRSSGDS